MYGNGCPCSFLDISQLICCWSSESGEKFSHLHIEMNLLSIHNWRVLNKDETGLVGCFGMFFRSYSDSTV